MGRMRELGGDYVYAGEHLTVDGQLNLTHIAYERKNRELAFESFNEHAGQRAWVGDVFFDHARGVVHERPNPTHCGAPHPFLLVRCWHNFELDSPGSSSVEGFDSAAEVIAEAQRVVGEERAAGASEEELWEVYGVRVLRYRKS